MHCPECGKINDKQSRFCWNCGTEISQHIPGFQEKTGDSSSLTIYPQKLSKTFFMGSIAVGLVLGQSLNLLTVGKASPLQALASFMLLYGMVVLLVFIYKMWDSIQDGYARTSPGKAVGFLFIPLFNVYWIFQAIWGFSQDFNRYINRHGMTIKPLPENLFMTVIVLPLVAIGTAAMAAEYDSDILFVISALIYLAHLVLIMVIVGKVCDGVNSIHLAGEQTVNAPFKDEVPQVQQAATSPQSEISHTGENGVKRKGVRGMSDFFATVKAGNVEEVRQHLDGGAGANSRGNGGKTPLHVAAINKHTQVAELLVERGADVNSKDWGGKTALHWAAFNGDAQLAELLIDRGAIVAIPSDHDLTTPLHSAAMRGHTETVSVLLERGAYVDVQADDGATPLHWAAMGGHTETAALLLERGAQANAKTVAGKTPLNWARRAKSPEVVEVLKQHGAFE